MKRDSRWRACLLVVSVSAAPTAGQEQELRGVVVDVDGVRVAAAEVFVVARKVWPFARETTVPVRVETDARGRFVARVRAGRGYSCWARFGERRRRITAVIACADPGRKVRLVETLAPLEASVRIVGLDRWRRFGARHCVAIDSLGVRHPLVVAADGETRLPVIPGDVVAIVVEDARRRVLVATAVWQFEHMRRTMRRNLIQLGIEKDGEQLPLRRVLRRLRRPVHVPIELESDAKLESVRIQQEVGGAIHGPVVNPRVRRVGTRRIEVVVPRSETRDRHSYRFLVTVPGFATERVGWDHSWNFPKTLPELPASDVVNDRAPLIRIKGMRAAARGGRLVADGEPVAGHELVGLVVRGGGDRKSTHTRVVRSKTAADGRFLFAGLRPSDRLARVSIAPMRGYRSGLDLAAPADLRDWTIDVVRDIRSVELAVRRKDGAPARAARVVLLRDLPIATSTRLWPSIETVADFRGCCRVPMFGSRAKVAIVTEEQFAFVEFDRPGRREVTLAPMSVVRGKVVDARDRPIPGAELWMRTAGGGGHADEFERFANRYNHVSAKARCDARGVFGVRVLPGSYDFELAAQIWLGTRRCVSDGGVHVYRDSIDDALVRIPVDASKR